MRSRKGRVQRLANPDPLPKPKAWSMQTCTNYLGNLMLWRLPLPRETSSTAPITGCYSSRFGVAILWRREWIGLGYKPGRPCWSLHDYFLKSSGDLYQFLETWRTYSQTLQNIALPLSLTYRGYNPVSTIQYLPGSKWNIWNFFVRMYRIVL